MNYIPSLQSNYTPVPNTFLQLVFSGQVRKEELVALLYLFSKTYGWKQEKGFAAIEDLVHEAGLTRDEAIDGIRAAVAHDQVLEMPLDPGNPEAGCVYLLATLENRRFLEAYATASQDGTPIPAAASAPAPSAPSPPPAGPGPVARSGPTPPAAPAVAAPRAAPPGPPPSARPVPPAPAAPSSGTLRLTDSMDAGLEDALLVAPDDLPEIDDAPRSPSPGGTTPTGSSRAAVRHGTPPTGSPAIGAGPGGPTPAAPGRDPLADWGYSTRTVEMIIRLLGRVPTKDEKARLSDLGASDTELIEAMGKLIEKKVHVYSSDLIVYEYEAMKSAARRQNRDVERRSERERRLQQQRDCRKCDGLGYFFVGVSGIQECDCRSSPG